MKFFASKVLVFFSFFLVFSGAVSSQSLRIDTETAEQLHHAAAARLAAATNFREAAIIGIIERLKNHHIEVHIFEPLLEDDMFMDCKVTNQIDFFINKTDIIIANRSSKDLRSLKNKVFTRDIFYSD